MAGIGPACAPNLCWPIRRSLRSLIPFGQQNMIRDLITAAAVALNQLIGPGDQQIAILATAEHPNYLN